MKKIFAVAFMLVCLAGCNDWERTTFQTLSSSKAVIDTAKTDYEAHTIPHNTCSYTLINDARAAQAVSVNSLLVYEQVKAAKGDTGAQEAVVVSTLATLGADVAQVKALYSNPNCGGSK